MRTLSQQGPFLTFLWSRRMQSKGGLVVRVKARFARQHFPGQVPARVTVPCASDTPAGVPSVRAGT